MHLMIAFTINPTRIEERKEGSWLLWNKHCWQLTLQEIRKCRRAPPDFGVLRRPCGPAAARHKSPVGLAEDFEY
jgi:hypothetical protein